MSKRTKNFVLGALVGGVSATAMTLFFQSKQGENLKKEILERLDSLPTDHLESYLKETKSFYQEQKENVASKSAELMNHAEEHADVMVSDIILTGNDLSEDLFTAIEDSYDYLEKTDAK